VVGVNHSSLLWGKNWRPGIASGRNKFCEAEEETELTWVEEHQWIVSRLKL